MRTPRRALAALAAAMLLATVVASPAAAAPRPAAPTGPEVGFFSVPYGPYLYWTRFANGGYSTGLATFDEWASQGFPTPRRAPVIYEKAPWSNTIIGAALLPGWLPESAAHALTFDEWASVGFPAPTVTTRLTGTSFEGYLNSPRIWAFNRPAFEITDLTYPQWVAAGSPTPFRAGLAPETTFHQWSTAPEIFMVVDGATQRLTFATWESYGYPKPTRLAAGFYKLTWDASIARLEDGSGSVLTWGDWVAEGFPTPAQVPVLPGDTYCYDAGLNVVSYVGLTVDTDLEPTLAVQRLGVPLESMPACAAA